MTGRSFFDTNVLLYALALPTGGAMDARAETAERLLGEGGQVSVQVLNEFVDVGSRKLKLTWGRIEDFLGVIEALCGPAAVTTAASQRSAVAIAKTCRLRIYDAMIVASAHEAGCTTLYTEDLQHGQVIDGVRIVNPFL